MEPISDYLTCTRAMKAAPVIAVAAALLLMPGTPAAACDAFVAGDCAVPHAADTNVRNVHFSGRIVGARPRGCPHRHCGCSLSLKVFGRIVPRLNLAANWLGFPRASPAPGMVAARRGHVMKLLAPVGGNRWTVWDPNSGGGKTRIHTRSIAGFAIVNPHATRMAEVGR